MPKIRSLSLGVVALVLTTFVAVGAPPATAVPGGPVLLDGGDFPDHGFVSGGVLQGGWVYAHQAMKEVLPNVTRSGATAHVAVLGSMFSTGTSSETGGNYYWATQQPDVPLTPQFFNGATAINQFFSNLAGGTVNPSIIVTAGTGSGNDLDSAEGTALANNASAIADFVNSGGGLIGHGTGTVAFGWLGALLPGINFPSGCDSRTLTLTAAGQAAFPGLTNSHIRSGPCHGHFTGDFGGLDVLAVDSGGPGGSERAVILGGAAAVLPGGSVCESPPDPDNPPQGLNVIKGTAGSDAIQGTPGDDLIVGMGGHDSLEGLGGNDVILAGDGNDFLAGGEGDDALCAGAGNDDLRGGAGNDELRGDAGFDSLSGGDGDDDLGGGDDNDLLDGGTGTNTADGGDGSDFCTNPGPPTATNCE